MKTLVILIVSIFAFNSVNGQSQDLALENVNEHLFTEYKDNKVIEKLQSYADLITVNSASPIHNMESTIANYDIRTNSIFDNINRAIYRVVFKHKNIKAVVHYDQNGEIMSSREKYRNVRLPFKVAATISKNNDGFHIKKTTVYKQYKQGSGFGTTYKVSITNGKETKTIKITQ